MSETILEVTDLSLEFGARSGFSKKKAATFKAVDQVSFSVKRGETFGIVGESGSGKTTLGRCILRVLEPTAGSIVFRPLGAEDVELVGAPIEKLRAVWRKVRMVFQDPQSSLNPRLRVIDLVGQCLRVSEGLKGKALSDRVGALLEKVGLRPEFLNRYPNAFSGGQRQRLGIARALATNPELVIADEAVSALDVSIQAQTLNLMQDLQEQFDLTYVFIAHDLAVVEHVCDRIAVMYRGQFVEMGSAEELFRNPKHPYTRALLAAVPVPDPRIRRKRQKLAEGITGEIPLTGCRFSPRCPHATDICRSSEVPKKTINGIEVLCHHAGEV